MEGVGGRVGGDGSSDSSFRFLLPSPQRFTPDTAHVRDHVLRFDLIVALTSLMTISGPLSAVTGLSKLRLGRVRAGREGGGGGGAGGGGCGGFRRYGGSDGRWIIIHCAKPPHSG